MSNNITRADLDAMFTRTVRAAKSVGVNVDTATLIYGSKMYGNSFKFVNVDPENGAHFSILTPHGFVGWTKREAYDTLNAYATAWEAVTSAATVLS